MIRPNGYVLVDISGVCPDLSCYAWGPITGSVTLTGIFLDINGCQVGNAISQAFTGAATITSLYNTAAGANSGTALPDNIKAFYGNLSADCYEGRGGQVDGTISPQNPGPGYPVRSASAPLTLGRFVF